MQSFLSSHTSTLYVLVRIVAGVLFSLHGIQKLLGTFGRAEPVELWSQMGLAGVIETLGGLSIAVGFYTSIWAFLASGQMAVAYVQAHLPRGAWPIENGGELAALYCFLFLYIASIGPGKWSLRH